jgi:predicted DNA-binding transcriptional regulator YafY
VAAAQLKVMAALPPELRSRASRIVQRFHLDAAGWFHADEAVPYLDTLSSAVWDGRLVRISYERGGDPVERTIGPLGLVLKGGVWYVIGMADGQIRTYRVSRVAAATVLDDAVERPEGFDLAAYWTESSAAYERDAPTIEVVVRIAEDQQWRVADVYGRAALEAAERLDEPDPDGWLHLRLKVSWPDEVASRMLAIGPSIEVLEPADVRERVIAIAGRVVARYRDSAPLEAGR